jgi:maltooligosyltrehalose trehalohydrolase
MTEPLHRLGAQPLDGGQCRFVVWAPSASSVSVVLGAQPERVATLERAPGGYFTADVDDVPAGSLYRFRLDGALDRPDPASRLQPHGVHGPSEVVAPTFTWDDADWAGLPWERYVVYEIHVGTYTAAGTFEAIVPHLPELKDLGVTAVELMPVAQFPGRRNWGYDGVLPFAVQSSYGGPHGLAHLVDHCHRNGLAVILDVVHNHLGPEGNYLADFGPYFTDRYHTPWGAALNFDGPDSGAVRRYFLDSARQWIADFHVDALRLDAVYAISDRSSYTFLEQLADEIHALGETLGRPVWLIPESNRNDPRLIRPRSLGGVGFDAQWNDDFHRALHTVLTDERNGHYEGYGGIHQLAAAYRDGFVPRGPYARHRPGGDGSPRSAVPSKGFVVYSQNHDQVGNRALGERLSRLVSFEALKLAAASVIFSPWIPLLFMGEEYGEEAPFPYFIDHSDPSLVEAVREGRRRRLSELGWEDEPADPQRLETFLCAKLDHARKRGGRGWVLWRFYRELLRLRRELAPLSNAKAERDVVAFEEKRALTLHCRNDDEAVLVVLNFNVSPIELSVPVSPARWSKELDSSESKWHGDGTSLAEELEGTHALGLVLQPTSAALWSRLPS